MKNKKKLMLIGGIVIIVAGICIGLYPVVTNIISNYRQKQMIKQVKSQILEAANARKSADTETVEEIPDYILADLDMPDYENQEEDELNVPFFFDEENPPVEEGSSSDTAASENTSAAVSQGSSHNDLLEDNTYESATGQNTGKRHGIADKPTPTPFPTHKTGDYNTGRLYGQDIVGIIEIEKIGLIYAIVEGVEDENIGVAIGHFPNTVMPGEVGNCCLAGHNGGRYGRYFGDIDDLTLNDEVLVTTLDGLVYTYYVKSREIVEPTKTSVLNNTDDGKRMITMVTCTNHGKERLIVRAVCETGPSYYTED